MLVVSLVSYLTSVQTLNNQNESSYLTSFSLKMRLSGYQLIRPQKTSICHRNLFLSSNLNFISLTQSKFRSIIERGKVKVDINNLFLETQLIGLLHNGITGGVGFPHQIESVLPSFMEHELSKLNQ